jgi:hypothetical protein
MLLLNVTATAVFIGVNATNSGVTLATAFVQAVVAAAPSVLKCHF